MEYLHWDRKKIDSFDEKNISDLYDKGYVFTRIEKGVIDQTRSVRINLSQFEITSENRRILKKVSDIEMKEEKIPFAHYSWEIGKMAKDFYDVKGSKAFSANKIKEVLTSEHNFNTILQFGDMGFAICYKNSSLLHYSYPFYNLEKAPKDMGLGMMLKAIEYAKKAGLNYIYLGSLQRPSDTYKLQFSGIEWFDGSDWRSNLEEAKLLLKEKHLHVIGICGVATSALAIAFKNNGWKVTGSDKGFFPPVSTELEKHEINFYAGWHPEKVGNPDIVVIGTASGSQNPETDYVKEKNIPIYSFAEAIGKFFVKENSVVVAGTWGKTSSSALLSYIFEKAGYDPTYMFGGISLSHEASAKMGKSKWSVFEGDEYKSSPTDSNPKFHYYNPTHVLLTAVSWDHADLYPTEQSYFDVFEKLVSKTNTVVASKDNEGIEKVIGNRNVIYYGKSNSTYVYTDVKESKNGLDFKINGIEIHSPMLGAFQAENITGCFAMACELGVSQENILEAIKDFKGLKRRLEKRFDTQATVFDDIAHSPEKAASVLKNLRALYQGKIIAVFEPNSGGRSHESVSKYDEAFKDADKVIIPRLTKLKIGDEKHIEGEELAKIISRTHSNVHYLEQDEEVVQKLTGEVTPGDVIVFLGSHGFRGMIERTITSLHQRFQ